jgi:hypothetical protein
MAILLKKHRKRLHLLDRLRWRVHWLTKIRQRLRPLVVHLDQDVHGCRFLDRKPVSWWFPESDCKQWQQIAARLTKRIADHEYLYLMANLLGSVGLPIGRYIISDWDMKKSRRVWYRTAIAKEIDEKRFPTKEAPLDAQTERC